MLGCVDKGKRRHISIGNLEAEGRASDLLEVLESDKGTFLTRLQAIGVALSLFEACLRLGQRLREPKDTSLASVSVFVGVSAVLASFSVPENPMLEI